MARNGAICWRIRPAVRVRAAAMALTGGASSATMATFAAAPLPAIVNVTGSAIPRVHPSDAPHSSLRSHAPHPQIRARPARKARRSATPDKVRSGGRVQAGWLAGGLCG